MKNILVPTDFSAEANHALEVALQLAKQTGGSVKVLHVLESPDIASPNFSSYGGPVNGAELPNSVGMDQVFTLKLMEVTKQRMHQLVEHAQQLVPDVAVDDTVEVARIDTGILQAIDRHNIDLVVIGAQGHGAMEHFFAGSHTERMVRLAPCPVLSVKHQDTNFKVRNIVFPSDFGDDANGALAGLRRITAAFPEAVVHLLMVTDNPNDQQLEHDMGGFARQAGLANYQLAAIDADNTSEGIRNFAQKINADLVVIPTHARTGLSGFFQTSIAETVATSAAAPVLTYHLAGE